MMMLTIQTIMLIAIAFVLGAMIGCFLRTMFGPAQNKASQTIATDDAAALSRPSPILQAEQEAAPTFGQAPAVPMPPEPFEPVQPVEKAQVAPVPPTPLVAPAPSKKPAKAATRKATRPGTRSAAGSAGTSNASSRSKAAKQKVSAAAAGGSGETDNLKLIRGIGPQNEARLNNLGISRFAQIAAWTTKDEMHFGDVLAFPGRIEREDWVNQAKALAAGEATEFSKRAKAGKVESSMGSATLSETGVKPAGTLDAPRGGKADNLTLIDGVGNAIEKKMLKLGIFHFDQIAAMSADELTWLGNAVGFPGRPQRENWNGEAKTLAEGGTTNHAKRVEKGLIKTSRKS